MLDRVTVASFVCQDANSTNVMNSTHKVKTGDQVYTFQYGYHSTVVNFVPMQFLSSHYNATIMAYVASRPHRYTTRYDFQCVTERVSKFLRAWCWIAGRNNHAHWFTRNVLSTQEYNVWVGVVNTHTHINMARTNTRTHVYVCLCVCVCGRMLCEMNKRALWLKNVAA